MRKLEDTAALEAIYAAPVESSLRKVTPVLTPLYRMWIEAARFCVLSTVGPEGVHGSPRGDDGPVVHVQDERTLLMPDWKGNNRLDCLRDILLDGRTALLFMIPRSTTTVRVNAQAWLTDDTGMRQSFEQRGKHPATVIVFEVAEVYTQCAKALMRSGLWERDDREGLPTVGDILAEVTAGDFGGPEYDRTYVERAQSRMW